MNIFGLSTDPVVQEYLKGVYGLECTYEEGFPIFQRGDDPTVFVGGFKLFYAIVQDASLSEVRTCVQDVQKRHVHMRCALSVADGSAQGTLIHYLLDVGSVTRLNDRFALYDKKTRNQVKKSYASRLRVEVGSPSDAFFQLYEASMARLKSPSRKKVYFETLEQYLGSRIVCFSLYEGNQLIGCNYCIVFGEYVFLLSNVSDATYWHQNINNRLYDEMIAWAIQKGIRFIDFGPGTRKDESHNHFKEGFGAERRVILDMQNIWLARRLMNFLSQKIHNVRLRMFKLTH